MRKYELLESLLSSRAYNMPDRRFVEGESTIEDYQRLNRKITPSLPEVRQVQKRQKSRPLLCPFIFSPQSRFIICWEVLNIFLIYVYFMEIPITIAFQNHRSQEENQRFFQIINFPAASIFLCGIFINLNTSFYQDGLLRKDPKQIRKNYLRTSFLPDIISLLSLLIYEGVELFRFNQRETLKFVVLLCYLKAIQLMKIQRTIINSFDLNRRIKAGLKLFLLLMKIFLICNIVACGAFFISDNLSNKNNILLPDGTPCRQDCYWVLNVKYANVSLKDVNSFNVQYIYSLYWASTTMISIGYGDITPRNPTEITYTIVIQFLSCLLYAYAINTIWSIIQQLNAKKMKIHSRLNIINLYMRDKEIGPQLMSRINAYLNNYYYAKNLRERQTEAEIIGQLTPALKRELFFQSYSVVFTHRFFKSMSSELIEAVSEHVQEVGYYQDQTVVLKEFQISPCLFYVRKGELIHFTGGPARIALKNIYTRDFVGLFQFVTQISHESVLKAVKYTLTYLLKFHDWRSNLCKYQTDFQNYYQIKEDLQLYNSMEKIGYRCFFCSSNKHRTQLCFDSHIRQGIVQMRWNEEVRDDCNPRRKYVRRQFKIHFHQKHERARRKMTMKGSQIGKLGRLQSLQGSLLHTSKTGHWGEEMSSPKQRKNSFDYDLPQSRKGNRLFIRNHRTKVQNMKAIQKIRKQYASRARIYSDSQSEWAEQEIKVQEISMDILANYSNYYPIYNPTEFNQRDQSRRRITRSFV